MESRPNDEIHKVRRKCRIDEEVASQIVSQIVLRSFPKTNILLHFEGEKVIPKWLTKTRTDVHKVSIKQETARDRARFSRMGSDFKGFKEQIERNL